jgi:hypothetical protein
MRDAWRVEPHHSTHRGRALDELLAAMAEGRDDSTLDLSMEEPFPFDGSPAGSPPGSPGTGSMLGGGGGGGGAPWGSPTGSLDEGSAAAAQAAARGAGCSRVLPVYPGPGAAFAPVCKHLPTLQQGRAEGFESMQRLLVPALSPRLRAR